MCLHPLLSSTLRFGNPGASHVLCGVLHVFNRTDDCEPHVSVNVVRHEATIPIQICQLIPCSSRSSPIREVFSRFPVPLLSFQVVLLHTIAIFVHLAQTNLRVR